MGTGGEARDLLRLVRCKIVMRRGRRSLDLPDGMGFARVKTEQGGVMEPNSEAVTPRRRSFIPGASEEIPVTQHVEDVEAGYEATEVYEALDVEQQTPPPSPGLEPAQALPWFRRTWVMAAAAGAVALGVTIGVIVALTSGGSPMAAPTVSPSPSETSPSPSA